MLLCLQKMQIVFPGNELKTSPSAVDWPEGKPFHPDAFLEMSVPTFIPVINALPQTCSTIASLSVYQVAQTEAG